MAEMNVRAGDRIATLHKPMTQSIIDAWAAVSGDYNPLHIDPEYANETAFGGTIAHGHLALAWMCELMFGWAGAVWLEGGELRDVRFVAPIRPDEEYQVTGLITDVHEEHVVVALEVSGPSGVCVRGAGVTPID